MVGVRHVRGTNPSPRLNLSHLSRCLSFGVVWALTCTFVVTGQLWLRTFGRVLAPIKWRNRGGDGSEAACEGPLLPRPADGCSHVAWGRRAMGRALVRSRCDASRLDGQVWIGPIGRLSETRGIARSSGVERRWRISLRSASRRSAGPSTCCAGHDPIADTEIWAQPVR